MIITVPTFICKANIYACYNPNAPMVLDLVAFVWGSVNLFNAVQSLMEGILLDRNSF